MHDPDWTPDELKRLQIRGDWGQPGLPDEGRASLKDKLLKDVRMREGWSILDNYPKAKRKNWKTDFLHEVGRLAAGPRELDTQTQREAVARLERMIKASQVFRREQQALGIELLLYDICADQCEELRSAVKAMEDALTRLEPKSPHSGRNKRQARKPERYRASREAWIEVQSYYDNIAYQGIAEILAKAETLLQKSKPTKQVLSRPRHKNALLHYFVRSLTDYMIEEFKHPLRELVGIVAEVIFDLPKPLTQDRVSRIAPIRRDS